MSQHYFPVVVLLLGALLWFFTQAGKQPSKRQRREEAIRKAKLDEAQKKKDDDAAQHEEQASSKAAPQGKSLKELKALSSKKKKKAGSSDPKHESYMASLKGLHSSLVDVDFCFTRKWLVAIVGEADSRVTAYAIRASDTKPTIISKSLKLEGAMQVLSVSIARPQVAAASNDDDSMRFVIAIACFDHCQALVYQLKFAKDQFTFSPEPVSTLANMHKFPIQKLRLSKKQARFLVTCGAKQDVLLKLWNVGTKSTGDEPAVPINQISTGQILHKDMAQCMHNDLFAVAAQTSEVKVFNLGSDSHAQTSTVVAKALTLTGHKREVISLSFCSDLCCTVGKDNQLIIYRLDMYYKQSKVVFQMQLLDEMVNETTRVAIKRVEAIGKEKEKIYFALAFTNSLCVFSLSNIVDGKADASSAVNLLRLDGEDIHNGQLVDSLQFVQFESDDLYSVVLASSSALDQKVNFWTIN